MKQSIDSRGYLNQGTAVKSDLVYSTDMDVMSEASQRLDQTDDLKGAKDAELANSFKLPYSTNLLRETMILEDNKNTHLSMIFSINLSF